MSSTNYQEQVAEFLRTHNIRAVIGFSGGYRDNAEAAQRMIEQSMNAYQGKPIAILTGGTDWNIPGDATRIAKDYGLPVIGVLPQTGEPDKIKGLDLELVIPPLYAGSEWCDESQLFAKISDGIELIGGGPGAGVEIFQAMKISLDRVYDKKKPIFIAPITGFGGIEEMLYTSPFVNKEFMPEKPFADGTSAAEYLLSKLNL
jgi:predicted Rossmann-fold nucleotide-binding protein